MDRFPRMTLQARVLASEYERAAAQGVVRLLALVERWLRTLRSAQLSRSVRADRQR